MLKNYTKRHSIVGYTISNWISLRGFEQSVIGGNSKYYAIDSGVSSRIVLFDQNWTYHSYHTLPYKFSYTAKYIGGYFYFSSLSYFYKTNINFFEINSHIRTGAEYRQFVYDPSSSRFYVASFSSKLIDIFDTSCSLLDSIDLGNQKPYGLAIFNGNLYAGLFDENKIKVIQNKNIIKEITVGQCAGEITGITVDAFGYLAISCHESQLLTVYDSDGNYMNSQITTSSSPYVTSVDSKGRLVIMTENSLDIYY